MPLRPKPTTRKERLDKRSAVPVVAAKIKSTSFFAQRFVKRLARSSLCVVRRLKRDWREFCGEQPEHNPLQVYPDIDIDTELPPREAFIAFTTHQALSSKGRISEYSTRDTIRSLMGSFFGIWRREALKPVPFEYTQQVYTFIDSEQLAEIVPLCTDSMPKHSMSATDFEVLARALFRDTGFRTLRMVLQVAYLINIQSLMTERPGALVEGSKYNGTNEALTWGEHDFHVIPNEDDPHHPLIIIVVKIRRQKGYRGKKSVYKEFVLYPEPNANRAMCPVTQAVALAIEDQIFADVTTAEQIFSPKIPPTDHHILTLKLESRSQCVARVEVLVNGVWGVSSDRALNYTAYSGHLRRVSLADGFIVHVTAYCFRRGASNRISRELEDNDLTTLMGHTKDSRKFQNAYQSRLVDRDLAAVLYNREENTEHVTAGKTVSSMSARRDNNAPVKLPLEHVGLILNEPELVDMRRAREKLAQEISETSGLLVSADVDEEEQKTVAAKVLDLKKAITQHDKEYCNIVRREKKHRLVQVRTDYFAGASARQLTGTAAPQRIPAATRGKENEPGPTSKPLPRCDAIEELIKNFFDAGLSFDTTADSILGYIDALDNIPAKHKAVCYFGESPDEDNECPACDKECTLAEMPKGIGRHIHECIAKTVQKQAMLNAEDAFEPTRCLWNGCFATKTVWKTRKSYQKHVHNHLVWLGGLSLHGDIRRCRWFEHDRICDENAQDHASFWDDHFANAHGINTSTSIRVDHCASCGEWYEDIHGDYSAWNDHCVGHYEDAFAPFQERLAEDLILHHDNNLIVVDDIAEYDPSTGFGGKQPVLHGYIEQSIALRPFYCPYCVFDTTLPMFSRMKQFRDNTIYSRHVFQQHINDLKGDSICPVPSCGTHVYSLFDLVHHLVLYHRLPLVGTRPGRKTRKLRIPTMDSAGNLVVPLTQNKAKGKKASISDSSDEEPKRIPKEQLRATSVIEISDDDVAAPGPSKRRIVISDDEEEEEPGPLAARSSSVVFVEPGPSKRGVVDEADKETKKRRLEEPIAGPSAVDDDADDDSDGIDEDTKLYICLGCYNQRQDIRKHLEASRLDSRCRKKGQFQKLAADGTRSRVYKFTFPEDTSAAGSRDKKDRNHYCIKCDHQYVDIRDHIPDKCQAKTFRIKDPKNPAHRRARNAPEYIFADWIKTAPPRIL